MDEDEVVGSTIAKEDVIDAIEDMENTDVLMLLTEYYKDICGKSPSIDSKISKAKKCAEMLYAGKRYEEVNIWLDEIATEISDNEGPDSELYMAFTENDELETLRLNATDRASGAEEEDNDFADDDE